MAIAGVSVPAAMAIAGVSVPAAIWSSASVSMVRTTVG